jgi:asparagine synthase (glutamine-hydrolysing)
MSADARFYLPEDVLVKVDRMSMAHGLEVRSPLLSKRIVELAFSIPSSLKLERGVSKALLRRLAARHIPQEIVHLPKTGFHIPLDRWLRNELKELFEGDVFDRSNCELGWLDLRAVKGLWAEHQSGRVDHGYTLWMLWVLHAWSRGLEDTSRARASGAAAEDVVTTRLRETGRGAA